LIVLCLSQLLELLKVGQLGGDAVDWFYDAFKELQFGDEFLCVFLVCPEVGIV